VSTWNRTNKMPTAVSGAASELPFCTAPISAPVATASPAGSSPRSASKSHHAYARPGAARNKAPKN
jgi:hypothetical protein